MIKKEKKGSGRGETMERIKEVSMRMGEESQRESVCDILCVCLSVLCVCFSVGGGLDTPAHLSVTIV